MLPSFFSLETTSLTVDKASGSALLTVKRTGALQYVATVDYHTVDGTARAGVDLQTPAAHCILPATWKRPSLKSL